MTENDGDAPTPRRREDRRTGLEMRVGERRRDADQPWPYFEKRVGKDRRRAAERRSDADRLGKDTS